MLNVVEDEKHFLFTWPNYNDKTRLFLLELSQYNRHFLTLNLFLWLKTMEDIQNKFWEFISSCYEVGCN